MKDLILPINRKKAIETLIDLNVLIPVSSLKMFHGRAGNGQEWDVDPNFNNGANNTGNHNVNSISTLYTTDYDTAVEFAKSSLTGKQQVEVYQIQSLNENALIYNRSIDHRSLTKEQLLKYYKALHYLTDSPATKYAPLSFEQRGTAIEIQKQINYFLASQGKVVTLLTTKQAESLIEQITSSTSTEPDTSKRQQLARKMVYCTSTLLALFSYPKRVISCYLEKESIGKQDGNEFYIDFESVKNWLADNNIIGMQQEIISARLGKNITSWSIFDLSQIAKKDTAQDFSNKLSSYDSFIKATETFILDKNLFELLQNGKPEEIMKNLWQSTSLRSLYKAQTNNWENWDVAQHTVATLDFFDKNYALRFPKALHPFIKTILLAHDIGKGFVDEYQGNQKEANKAKADILFDEFEIEEKFRNLIKFIITDSQDFTSQYYFNNLWYKNNPEISLNSVRALKDKQLLELQTKCAEQITSLTKKPASAQDATTLLIICDLLQHCDSGAYTRFARIKDYNNIYFYAGNDKFTKSFKVSSRKGPRLRTYLDDFSEQDIK